ncbi:hypothetical protein HTVC034P_gp37 [Pelagibacter phage HTVC034P]|nr:hypothetical protein HTVC034P_gp37 [Pelagibacter phage HTVC034P]
MALNFANNNSLSAITSLPASVSGGAFTLLETQTASSSATIDFTSNIDSTYDSYVFKFINIHCGTDGTNFTFQGSSDGGSSYGKTLTTTFFRAVHGEDGSSGTVSYETDKDLAQSTSFQRIGHSMSTNDKACLSGTMHLFNPSSTTFAKHFFARAAVNYAYDPGYNFDANVGGYFNTTDAINAMQFKMSSGNIDDGVIKLYGIS